MDTTLDRPVAAADLPTAALGSLVRWVAYALFFMMLFVPTAYQPLKGALLGFVLVGIVLSMVVTGRLGLHRHVLIATLWYAAIGAFFILRGHMAGEPGALAMFNVYVTWPIVYTILVAGATSRRTLRDLMRVLVAAANAVACYSIIFVLWAAGHWPDALYYPLDQGQTVGFYGSYIEFGLYSTSTLLFVVPFLFGALLVFPKDGAPVRRATLWISLALNLVTVLLSGRRALLVLVPLAPAIALVFRSWLTPTVKRQSRRIVRRALWGGLAVGALAVVVIAALGGLAPAGFIEMVATGFQFDTDPVAMLRRDQFHALISGWLDHPLLGTGHGAPASVLRSVEMPWAYELSYVALLFHTGVLGTMAYASGLVWIVATAYRAARAGWSEAPEMIATLVGTTVFLAANATNPYLEKYDYLWVIFLPLAFVNAWLVARERARARG